MDPKITAVVMIEYQNDFVKSGGAQHELVRGVMESTGMLANSLRLAEESRLAREGHHTHIQAISAYPECRRSNQNRPVRVELKPATFSV